MKCLRRIERKVAKLATENQEYRYHEKNGHKHQYRAKNYREEVELSGHICRMQDDSLLKQAVFDIMDGKNKTGRPKSIGGRTT